MQRQLSFLEATATEDGPEVWATLDDEQRAEAVAMLARLIAKVSTRRTEAAAAKEEEKGDE